MRAASVALFLITASACGTVEASKPPVEVEMRNVDLHITPQIDLQVRHLRGRFIPAGTRPAPFLDDPSSYTVAVDSGEVAVDLPSLNAIVTRALERGRSNVRRVEISVDDDGQLRQKGVVKKGISVPFDMKSSVGVTADGLIRIHSESVKGFGVPVNPLLKLFRLQTDDLIRVEPGHGLRVDGNDLLLDVSQLLPPPGFHGKVTSVRVEQGSLIQVFGPGTAQAISPPATAKNHIYWRGSQLAFGKLTMTDTDLELVDEDPRDPFDFSVDRWNQQLVAGYSKTTADRGLRAHMPDYNDLPHRQTLQPSWRRGARADDQRVRQRDRLR
jgi:hypothetical protein